ncbi:MAG: hypothetical protein LV479_03520 [Methylacidiphilales bacterium]|nr:hypothetical protein [Candidatus Methylacidiphilales bacterium]
MHLFALVVFASPDLSGMGDALLLIGALLPIFAFGALHGINVWLGILQIIVLFVGETLQWQLTKHALFPLRIISAITTYLALNVVFSFAIFCPRTTKELTIVSTLGMAVPIVFAVFIIVISRATNKK